MSGLTQVLTRLAATWREWTLAQRAGILASLVASVATVVGVIYWATLPEYVLLADRLSPAQAAEAVALLEREQIAYKLNFSGSAISVHRPSLARARLAVKDALGETAGDAALSATHTPWDSPAVQADHLLRQQEVRLARSIAQIHGIRSATVHVGRSDPSPFLRNTAPTSASVIVDLQPGALLSGQQAQGIIAFVAHAVEGLAPEGVTVMDTSGRILSSAAGPAADVAGRLEYRTRMETSLAAKAESMLQQMLGPGRATVRISADIDFTETKRSETRFDPDAKVKKNETITTITQSGASRLAGSTRGGPAGTASNITPTSGPTGAADSYKEQHTTTDFDNPKIDESVHELPGRLKRLTIAAIVDLPTRPADAPDAPPLPSRADVEAIIKQAVGFDSARQDEIQVVIAPLESAHLLEQELLTAAAWQRYEQIARAASLGIGATVAALVALLVLKRMRPVVIAPQSTPALSTAQLQKLMKVSQLTRENPEVAAKVIKAWLQTDMEPSSSQQPRSEQLRKSA